MTAPPAPQAKSGPLQLAIATTVLVVLVGVLAWGGFITMLLLGMLFGSFDLLAPLGYWPSVGLFLALQAFVGLFTLPGKRAA